MPIISSLNDEKVVKPPQKPVIHSAFCALLKRPVLLRYPYRHPIINHPSILAMKVPNGNDERWQMIAPSFSDRNLRHVPANPPMPAIIVILNIIFRH